MNLKKSLRFGPNLFKEILQIKNDIQNSRNLNDMFRINNYFFIITIS